MEGMLEETVMVEGAIVFRHLSDSVQILGGHDVPLAELLQLVGRECRDCWVGAGLWVLLAVGEIVGYLGLLFNDDDLDGSGFGPRVGLGSGTEHGVFRLRERLVPDGIGEIGGSFNLILAERLRIELACLLSLPFGLDFHEGLELFDGLRTGSELSWGQLARALVGWLVHGEGVVLW